MMRCGCNEQKSERGYSVLLSAPYVSAIGLTVRLLLHIDADYWNVSLLEQSFDPAFTCICSAEG